MAPSRFLMNGESVWQPDSGLTYGFETKYTKDSDRTQSGKGHFTPLFTVEQYGYKATNIPVSEVTKILKIIAKGKKFSLKHFSMYHGEWRTDDFYVGKSGNITIGSLKDGDKKVTELSFNMTGVNPI